MRVGTLRNRIVLQRQLFVQGDLGENMGDWVDFASVRAQADPLRGKEYFAAAVGQPEQKTFVRFTIRYRAGVTQSMRVAWRGVAHKIEAVIDVDGLKREIELVTVRDGEILPNLTQDYAAEASYFSEDEYYSTGQQSYAAQNSYFAAPGYVAP